MLSTWLCRAMLKTNITVARNLGKQLTGVKGLRGKETIVWGLKRGELKVDVGTMMWRYVCKRVF
jgi:hypothetical protein